jgi:protein tyrosine/serine phosphatase
MARIARWDRPIDGVAARIRAWINMIFVDHAIFRFVYLNHHRVTPQLWRAAQPAPHDIRWFARQGVRTVVYLRGGREHGSWPLEREACQAAGLTLTEFTARSREAPDKETLLQAATFFQKLEYPVLIHCKSGADRAGFVAALYLLVHEKRPASEALKQLDWRYGHFRSSKTGVLDRFFESYRDEGEAKGLDFRTWVETVYDPAALQKEARSRFWSSLLVDRILRRE